MTQGSTPDPAAFFRDMLGQWEQFTNKVGGDAMKSPEFAKTMQGANAANMQAQAQLQQFMERALTAANMPSKTEFAELSARIAKIEDAIARIEAAVVAPTAPSRPKPARTRKPPAKA